MFIDSNFCNKTQNDENSLTIFDHIFQVTMMLAELPKDQQDVASNAVQSHMRKSSTGSEPGSPLTMGSPKILSPGVSPLRDSLDHEEIYKSLRKTTAEIQNYSFETLGKLIDFCFCGNSEYCFVFRI